MATSSTRRPAKPYQEFPLFPHSNGQWAKKIRGKLWYFGRWEDPDAALTRYRNEIDDIWAGRDPRRMGVAEVSPDSVSVADMVNLFLAAMDDRCQAEEITKRHFADYRRSGKFLVEFFGRRALVASLRAADFAELRGNFPEDWGPTKTGTEIQRMRTMFRWAAEAEVIPSLPNFGPGFKKPQKSVVRRAKLNREAKHGKLDFSADELQVILGNCDGWLRACVLLGLNSGFGATDCGRLRSQNIDFESGWYDLPRWKTAIPRKFHVWPETRLAIREAMQQRPIAKNEDDDDLCFLTSQGRPVWWESDKGNKTDNVGHAFSKLLRRLDKDESVKVRDLSRPGRGFYSLRRTYETVAGNTKDQAAVNLAMGHFDDSMAAVYRQGLDDNRLINVAEHVRQWLWTRDCEACGAEQFCTVESWRCDRCQPESEEADD